MDFLFRTGALPKLFVDPKDPNVSNDPTSKGGELFMLIEHFGKEKTLKGGGTVKPLVDGEKCLDEFEKFKSFMHSNQGLYKRKKTNEAGELTDEDEECLFSEFFKAQYPTLKRAFPNLIILMQIALIVPMTSVDCERGFSAMNRIKSKTRNRMLNVVLDHLMRISLSKFSLAGKDGGCHSQEVLWNE